METKEMQMLLELMYVTQLIIGSGVFIFILKTVLDFWMKRKGPKPGGTMEQIMLNPVVAEVHKQIGSAMDRMAAADESIVQTQLELIKTATRQTELLRAIQENIGNNLSEVKDTHEDLRTVMERQLLHHSEATKTITRRKRKRIALRPRTA
jgi:hypothetical protein